MAVVELFGKPKCPLARRQIINITRYTIRAARWRGRVEIRVVENSAIKKFNKLYRRKNRPTDILSFVWRETPSPMTEKFLGTVIIAPSYIKKQAKNWDVPWREEFTRSLVHGLLHLAGEDHVKKQEAKRMFAKQEKIVAKFA